MVISGGLAAVIYTDTLQTFVMIIGAIILTIMGLFLGHFKKNNSCICVLESPMWGLSSPSTAFNKIGGFGNLEHVYSVAVPSKIIPNSTCHLPRQDAMHLFRDAVTGDLPWPGMTLGLTILATWYWCSDQVHAQKHTGVEATLAHCSTVSQQAFLCYNSNYANNVFWLLS